jgi:hypothetical protein
MTLEPIKQQTTVPQPGSYDFQREEWQECRSVIARLDNTLVDLRKTVFGLASGLLTTGGVLGGIVNLLPNSTNGTQSFTVPQSVIAALVSVTMVLITVLFVVDRYYSVLHWGAVKRALVLEETLGFSVTSEILGSAKGQPWCNWVVLLQYGGFLVVSLFLGVAVMGAKAIPSSPFTATDLMWVVFILTVTLIVSLHLSVEPTWRRLKPVA